MFQIGELKDKELAMRLTQELQKMGISTQLQSYGGDYVLFVTQEKDVPVALDHYRIALGMPRSFEVPEEIVRMREIPKGRLSYSLILICIVVYVSMRMESLKSFSELLFFSSQRENYFAEIKSGQIWRLFTPALLHFNLIHILFNMLWLKDLGSLIEYTRGIKFTLGFILFVGIGSNLGQYLAYGPEFGGMSGVVYGFLGYIWIYKLFNPETRYSLPKSDVIMMIVWFFLCLFGLIGPIANTAHGIGLGLGMLIGASAGYRESSNRDGLKWAKWSTLACVLMLLTLMIEFLKQGQQFYFKF